MNMPYTIALITPPRLDYMTETVIDGILRLGHDFRLSGNYPSRYDVKERVLGRDAFVSFAQEADLIFLMAGKGWSGAALGEEIGAWEKTIFIDGSELGRDRWRNPDIMRQVESGDWKDSGKIDFPILKKCALYFRREKPYVDDIIPLPYGIETRYGRFYEPRMEKNIDFVCIFGQEQYPVLRKQVREYLESYCKEQGLACRTEPVPQDEFYRQLARAKVGISVGGGGFDTARFWEILGNNCQLLTERIDIFRDDDERLSYGRIHEFDDLEDFKTKLREVHLSLASYPPANLMSEYENILSTHSSRSRVQEILTISSSRGLLRETE